MANWSKPSSIDGATIISSANLMLPSMGFTERSLSRLMREDPLYDDDLSLVAIDKKMEAAATVLTAVDRDSGRAWFKLFFCRDDLRAELRSRVEFIIYQLKKEGIKEIRVSDRAGYHFRPGLEISQRTEKNLLTELGFEIAKSVVDYEVDLRLFTEFRGKEAHVGEYVITQAKNEGQLLDFISSNFGTAWAREAQAALRNGGAIEALKGNEVVGFAAYGGFEQNWFGPIGVLKEYRKSGIGSTLLFSALTRMREMGITLAVIPWTDNLTFYSRINAITKVRHMDIMRKILQ